MHFINLRSPWIASALSVTLFALAPFETLANTTEISFKCSSNESCGTLFEMGCGPLEDSFILSFNSVSGFSTIFYGEVWTAKNLDSAFERDNLKSLVLGAPSGEIALLSVGDEWNYSLSIHYTSVGQDMNWVSTRGKCEVLS